MCTQRPIPHHPEYVTELSRGNPLSATRRTAGWRCVYASLTTVQAAQPGEVCVSHFGG